MDYGMIGKIEKSKIYSEERDRIEFESLRVTLRGDNDRAHRGLWDMVCKTRDNVLHRMAMVPRVMEARGLDVTPAMIVKFKQLGDQVAVGILETR